MSGHPATCIRQCLMGMDRANGNAIFRRKSRLPHLEALCLFEKAKKSIQTRHYGAEPSKATMVHADMDNIKSRFELTKNMWLLQRRKAAGTHIIHQAAPLWHGKELGQTRNCKVTPRTNGPFINGTKEGVRTIFDEPNTAFVAPLPNLRQWLGQSKKMGHQHGPDTLVVNLRDPFQLGGTVFIQRIENRLSTSRNNRGDHGGAMKCRNQDFVPLTYAEYFQCQQNGCPTTDGELVFGVRQQARGCR